MTFTSLQQCRKTERSSANPEGWLGEAQPQSELQQAFRASRQVPGLEEIAVDKELKVLGVPLSVDADRQRTLDKETGYLIEEIVKQLKGHSG